MLLGGSHITYWICTSECIDPAQHIKMAGRDLDDLDRDLSDVCNIARRRDRRLVFAIDGMRCIILVRTR